MSVSSTQFTVVYDGKALREGRMDVRDLAPALLALGDVLEQANRVLNKDRASVNVNVKAFKSGSFGINFELVQSCYESVKGMLCPGAAVRETLDILNALGFNPKDAVLAGGVGLYWLIKKSRGKKPKKIQQIENNNVSIVFEFDSSETEEIIVSSDVADLFNDSGVRGAVDKSLDPLRQEGIDSFGVEKEGQRDVLVESQDVSYYSLPSIETQDIPVDNTPQERILAIVSLSFKEDNKWRLSDGSAILNVKISDKTFLKRVNEGASFTKGDMLKVLLSTSVSYGKDGLKTEYEATKIIEHIKRPEQIWML